MKKFCKNVLLPLLCGLIVAIGSLGMAFYIWRATYYILDKMMEDLGFKSNEAVYAVTFNIPEIPRLEKPENNLRYGFTDDEIYILTQLLCGDQSYHGDGEYDFGYCLEVGWDVNYEEINKVLSVVMNRVNDQAFPDDVVSVVLQPNQFAVFPRNLYSQPSESEIEVVRKWCENYDKGVDTDYVVPDSHLYFCSGPNLTNVTRAQY